EHLVEEQVVFHWAQAVDVFEVGNIHVGGKHVHSYDNARLRTVAEFADALEGSIHGGAAGDFLDEGVAATEDVPRGVDQLIRMRRVPEVVCRKDEGLGEPAVPLFMLGGVLLELFEDLAIRVRGGDL